MTCDLLLSSIYVDGIRYVIMACMALGIAIQVAGIFCMIWFRFQKIPALDESGPIPGVSILKPCYGITDREAENFDGFFQQNYPGSVQLLFIVSAETDPVVPLVRDYIRRYPQIDAELVISKTRKSFKRKVDALFDGHQLAKHEVIIWSDSDVEVRPDYLRQMVGSLMEPGVSLVTTPQYEFGANNLPTAFKTLNNNTDVGTYISTLNVVAKTKKFAWGHSMAFRKAEFDAFGDYGWDMINRFMADDQSLPYLFAQHGKRTVLRSIYCPVRYADKTWSQMVTQKKIWAVCQRLAFKNTHIPFLLVVLAIPQISSFFLVLLSGFSQWSLQLFVAIALLRIFNAVLFEVLFLGSVRISMRYWWTVCLSDLMQLIFYSYAFTTDTVEFHGKKFRLFDEYFLEEVLESDPASGSASRLPRWAKSFIGRRS